MTIKDNLTLLFMKKKSLRILLFTPDKRVIETVVLRDSKSFNIGERKYNIEPDKVHYFKGVPFLAYVEDSIEAIDPNKLENSSISAEEYYSAINQNIVLQIMRYATKGDQKLINTILIGSGATIGILGAGLYYLFTKIQELSLQIIELYALIESLISTTAGGGGF